MATPFYRRIANRKKRRPKPPPRRPSLTTKQILAWADDHRATTGQWPHADAGLVRSTLAERWVNLDQCLRIGLRGLPGGSSLARLLAEHRGVRNPAALPRLTPQQIVTWRGRIGGGPASGPVACRGRSMKHRARPGRESTPPWPWVTAACPAVLRWPNF